MLFNKKKTKPVENDAVGNETNVQVSPPKKSKKSKRKKKNKKSLIGSLGLSESVLSVSRESMSNLTGAVRYVDGGYVLISLTDELLSDYSAKDENIGSFAKAVQDRAIEACILENDLDAGRLVIVPSSDSMDRMEEYSFLRKCEYEVVHLLDDMDEDDCVKVFDTLVTFDDITRLAEHPELTYGIEGNNVIFTDNDNMDSSVDTQSEGAADDIVSDVINIDSNDNIIENEIEEFELFDDNDTQDMNNISDRNAMTDDEIFGFDDDDIFGLDDDDEDDDALFDVTEGLAVEKHMEAIDKAGDVFAMEDEDDFTDFDDDYTEVIPQTKETIRNTIKRVFQNDDLGIEITDDLFNVHFNASDNTPPLFKFNTPKVDENSELELTIRHMADNANTSILKTHQANINALREDYFHALSQERENIASQLALDSEENDYGLMMLTTKEVTDEFMKEKGRHIREKKESLEFDYNRDRQAFIDDAISASGLRYDSMHKNELKRLLDTVEEQFEAEVKQAEDKKTTEILEARREKAAALFNSASVRIMQNLSDEFRLMQEEEFSIYQHEKQKMDSFLKENYASDIMRAKAIRDELARHNEVDDLKAKYAALQELNETRLEEVKKEAKDNLNAISLKHDKIIEEMAKDFESEIAKSRKREEKAAADLMDLQKDYAAVEEKKSQEFEHRLQVAQDEIAAKNQQIANMQQEIAKKNNLSLILMVVIGAAFLAVGIALGFILTPTASAAVVTEKCASMSMVPSAIIGCQFLKRFRKK